jgi:hypothetical protein
MLFIVRGHLQSSQVLRDGVKSCCMLGPGNFSGDELLSWCLKRPFIERLPPSSSTLVTLETTEAFAGMENLGSHGNPIGDKVPRGLPAPLSSPRLDASVGRTSVDQAAEPAPTELTTSFRLRSSIKEPHLSFPCHPASPRPSYLTRVSRSRQAHTPRRVGQVETRRGSPKRQSRHVSLNFFLPARLLGMLEARRTTSSSERAEVPANEEVPFGFSEADPNG